MVLVKCKGTRTLGKVKTSESKENSFKQLLELNNKVPYRSEVYFKFSDKLIQREYETWVKVLN